MTKIGDVGTLKELGVMPGDVVEHVSGIGRSSGYDGLFWTCHQKHPKGYYDGLCVVLGDGRGWMPYDSYWKFRLISRAADTPTLWRDMTPEQKGALLLAEYEGRQLQIYEDDEWIDFENDRDLDFGDFFAYRVRPEPPRVDLMADGVKVGTVAMRDGKVDHDSVEWV